MQGSKAKLAKAVGAAAAPTPLNTPSLRRENNGKDVTVSLVPAGAGVWGQTAESKAESASSKPAMGSLAKPAPWAKAEVQEGTAEASLGLNTPQMPKWAEIDSDEEEDQPPPAQLVTYDHPSREWTAEDEEDQPSRRSQSQSYVPAERDNWRAAKAEFPPHQQSYAGENRRFQRDGQNHRQHDFDRGQAVRLFSTYYYYCCHLKGIHV